MRFQVVLGVAAALIAMGLAALGRGYAEMASSDPVLPSWAAPVLMGVGGFLVLGGLIVLVKLIFQGRRDDTGKDDPPQTQTEVDARHSQGR